MQANSLPKRVALYARVSSDEQREGQTIDSQVAELERFAKQSTWQIARIYKDEGWSGAMLARPALDELRDDASQGHFHAVLINDVDRLARDVSHLGVIKRDLERHGVQVIFRKLPAEKSPTQNLMVNILGSFAEFERELIADRMRRGKRYKVEALKQFMGSHAPYGFRYIPKNRAAGSQGVLEILPEEAAVVRQMYSLVDHDGLSARKVMDRFNHMGIRPRKGSEKWAKSSVLRILRSEVYAGVWHYNKYEHCEPKRTVKKNRYRRSLKSSNRLRVRSEWLPVELPEQLHIISRSQWERVQRQLDQNRAFSPRNAKHAYLLTGLIRCAGCGRRYVGEPHHGRFGYRCYARCKKVPMIREDFLNETIWTALKKAILNPQIIIESVAKLNKTRIAEAEDKKGETTELEKSLQQIEIEESRLLEAYRLGAISAGQLGTELEKLNARRSSLETRRAALNEQVSKLSLPSVTAAVSDYCALVAQRLENLTFEEKQRLLRLVINEIVFDGTTARIRGIIPSASDTRNSEIDREAGLTSLATGGRIATTASKHCGLNPALEFLITAPIVRKIYQ